MRCSRCQGLGHIASECPNKRIVTLAECQASFGELEKEEEEGGKAVCLNKPIEEVEEGPDEGELLVIRRALNGLTSQNELEQRETIFHTKCTVGGKVCSLIIDGGSCANVASLGMVEKLHLQALAHPHPYNIQWLNKGKGLQVHSRGLIFLSIGESYHDELRCDIIPIDACHILLGRPWLFDRKVIHDGYLNTYSIFKDGKKITLAPIQPSQPLKPQKTPQKNLLLIPYLKAEPCLHPSLIPSFQAYNLAAPSKIPHGLFPQRTIIHKVDLPHETNKDLSSLRTNSKQAGEYDGDHPPNELTIIREGGGDSKEAEEVQRLARNKLKQSNSALGTSPEN